MFFLALRFRTTRIYQEIQSANNSKPLIASKTRIVKITTKQLIDSVTSPTRHEKSADITSAVVPTYATYEAMLEDDAHASNTRSFPEHSACSYQGLRKPLVTNVLKKSQTSKCHRRQLTSNDCTEVIKYFGQHGTIKPGQCNNYNAIKICTTSERKYHKRDEIQFSCDASACKGTRISLGLFDQTTGKIKWHTGNINRVSTLLKNHSVSSVFASGFALLKCRGGQHIQVLNFPKRLDRVKAQNKEKSRRFNINIILEDSLSRAHFYRTLLNTASIFRDIIYNQSLPSTLFEFEKVQSLASNTYNSLQRLFTAQKYLNSKTNCHLEVEKFLANDNKSTCTYGIEEMFGRYKRAGFRTLFQEDRCWFDHWGSFLDPRKEIGRVKDEKTRLSRWKDFVQIVEKSGREKVFDDYGMSILTCDVYKKYKVTNPFSSRDVPNVCFAGRHYSSYFLEYVKRYTELNDMAGQPFFAYTHLLTSHDTNGKRIVNDDENLADLFRHAAHLRNTVTIFTSDHGAKATNFAAYTTQGREEVAQPFLFIIVPHDVSKLLGPEAMDALVVNQNRLVGFEDLYHSLVSILDKNTNPPRADSNRRHSESNVKVMPTRLRGLFEPVPLDRTCEQMKLTSEVLCLCDGMDKTISNHSRTVQWAAEFALGTLNNRIQEQYTTALSSKSEGLASGFYGYGACQRYIGTGILRARHANSGLEQKLFFSLLAKPYDRKTAEVFDVEVSLAMNENANGVTLNNLVRVSPFNKYEECTDKGVEPKLCSCQLNKTLWRNELYSKTASQKSFNLKPQSQILENPCLAIISRVRKQNVGTGRWQNAIETYEAVNACPDVTYKLIIGYKRARKTRISLKFPKSVTLLPRTVTFLMSAKNSWKFGKFIPRFTFEKSRWKGATKRDG